MAGNYDTLYSLPANLYAEGSPLVIAAGKLLKENATGRVLAQLKLRNLSPKAVKAARVRFHELDTAGLPLDCVTEIEYLDFLARPGEEFGQKSPVYFKNLIARRYRVELVRVVFEDDGIWTEPAVNWEPLPAPVPLEAALGDPELVRQYRFRFGDGAAFLAWGHKDLWLCACGTLHRNDEGFCCRCGLGRDALLGCDLQKLAAEKEERVARERAAQEAVRLAEERAAAEKRAAAERAAAEKRAAAEQAAAEKRAAAEKAAAEKRAAAEKAAAEKQAAREARTKRAGKPLKAVALVLLALAVCAGALLAVTKVILPNRRYNAAEALLEAGQYEEAIAAFQALDGYRDSDERAAEAAHARDYAAAEAAHARDYAAAEALLAEGQYEEAIAAFQALDGYRDSADRIDEAREAALARDYAAAEALAAREPARGAMAFFRLGDYRDARERSLTLWAAVAPRKTVVAGQFHTVGLKTDGTVVAVGWNNSGQCDVSDMGWTNIVAVAAGRGHTVGLRADGTVVAAGRNDFGQCDVDRWTDIVAIAAGEYHTVGLRADGTVIAVGWNDSGQCKAEDWTDIVAIAASGRHTVGLRADGTVVAVGWNSAGQCGVDDWRDIVAIAAGHYCTVGLRADGTVVAVGRNINGECEVTHWSDSVAVAAGMYHTVGLRADGSVVSVGWNDSGQRNVDDWTDIVAIAAGSYHTVGLRADGTVVAVGYNYDGQCNVDDWRDIRVPEP